MSRRTNNCTIKACKIESLIQMPMKQTGTPVSTHNTAWILEKPGDIFQDTVPQIPITLHVLLCTLSGVFTKPDTAMTTNGWK